MLTEREIEEMSIGELQAAISNRIHDLDLMAALLEYPEDEDGVAPAAPMRASEVIRVMFHLPDDEPVWIGAALVVGQRLGELARATGWVLREDGKWALTNGGGGLVLLLDCYAGMVGEDEDLHKRFVEEHRDLHRRLLRETKGADDGEA